MTSNCLHGYSHHTPAAAATLASAIASQETDTAKKEKKVRLKRVPKGVVLGVTPPPDPERWLKKSERSTYGAGSKRRKGGGGSYLRIVKFSHVRHVLLVQLRFMGHKYVVCNGNCRLFLAWRWFLQNFP